MHRISLPETITHAALVDETDAVQNLLAAWPAVAPDEQAVALEATRLAKAARAARRGGSGVDGLMHEFSLSSQEGLALMGLAEALLRIPDPATRDVLIRDKMARGNWQAHLHHHASPWVDAAAWGLYLGSRLLSHHHDTVDTLFSRLLADGGEPLLRHAIERAMGLIARQFVIGENIDAALHNSLPARQRGYTHSFDMLGEAALTERDAEGYFSAYRNAIEAIGRHGERPGVARAAGISVKLSALHPRYALAQSARVHAELYPRLRALAQQAAGYGMGMNIDAEEAERLEISLELVERLLQETELAHWPGLGVVVQAYQKRCLPVIDHLLSSARQGNRRLMIRLVKGAYWDGEIKRAQAEGLAGYPVYTQKAHTDLAYLLAAARLLDAADRVYPQFATHNAHTIASVARMASDRGVSHYEFQCLYGMGETIYRPLLATRAAAQHCRIYAPVGSFRTLLPYLVRRLLENGANNAFVHRLLDRQVDFATLLAPPVAQVRQSAAQPHPRIPLPIDLYRPSRQNSMGIDWGCSHETRRLAALFDAPEPHAAQPEPAAARPAPETPRQCANPADPGDSPGSVRAADLAHVEQALCRALAAAPGWQRRAAAERAQILRAAADLLEAERDTLFTLLVREAGKTWRNAVAEIREAADFCRYYAAAALAMPPQEISGVLVAISPWNFPLAIFVGQIAGALAAGKAVIAKPAESTPLVAHRAIALFYRAGVPPEVLHFLPGSGERIGTALVSDPRIAGVLFTGSLAVAKTIQFHLAQRPPQTAEALLVAETGGINALIADASAHVEQLIADVLISAFDSAGQRCSALRLLCLQEEIAEDTLTLLKAAMAELRVGNPRSLASDIGPLIEGKAKAHIAAHIEQMRALGWPVFQPPLPADARQGHFLAPTLIEIGDPRDLQAEIFGPVLHVLRYRSSALYALIDTLNASGHALTFGLHTRIEQRMSEIAGRIRAGNVYINRSIIGATVGVQPFGGRDLSGTGPKAGGPLFVPLLAGVPPALPRSAERNDPAAALLEPFAQWASREGMAALAETIRQASRESLWGEHITLPGPVGERNTLSFRARGRVLCLAEDPAFQLHAWALALATGNTPVSPDTASYRALAARLPESIASRLAWAGSDQLTDIDLVLHQGGADSCRALRMAAAQRPGALLAAIDLNGDVCCILPRLICEQLCSCNTAAAGGNAALLMLDADKAEHPA